MYLYEEFKETSTETNHTVVYVWNNKISAPTCYDKNHHYSAYSFDMIFV